MTEITPIIPGATLGILGGGQLGRMFVSSARTMGYEVIVFDPDPSSPAGSLATQHILASFDDLSALDQLAKLCDVITIEFENIPLDSIRYLEKTIPVYPSSDAIEIAQNRIKEKTFIQNIGLKTAPFTSLSCVSDCDKVESDQFPAILKTAELGYDGKGQVVCERSSDLKKAFMQLGQVSCVLEQKIDLKKEVSVIVCRGVDGQTQLYPVAENQHINGILDTSIVPANIPQLLAKRAQKQAQQVANELNYCGVLAIEFFISQKDELLINEMAPRPHNSGHYTIDACASSQFEQQVRMMCHLPAASSRLLSPVVMWNILGDIWPEDQCPDWLLTLKDDESKLHLYGKKSARIGRKMGHINILCKTTKAGIKRKDNYRNNL
ncbi:MAG: 5-(carboxyamino)imidazole ribonucleotide synthase [Gammaproteobacteria bacterium]|nr:5-(carboxyamino)imidazole ribonucleotide synthase [Gammaproteobacteria bacterium]